MTPADDDNALIPDPDGSPEAGREPESKRKKPRESRPALHLRATPIDSAVTDEMELVCSLADGRPESSAYGDPELVELTRGIWPDDLVVIAGDDPALTSALALQWCVDVAREGVRGHIVTGGRPAGRVVREMLGAMANTAADQMLAVWPAHEDFYRLIMAAGDLQKMKLTLDDMPGPHVADIRQRAGLLHVDPHDGPLGVIVVDGLELLACPGDHVFVSEQAVLANLVHELKQLALEFVCPVVVVWHLVVADPPAPLDPLALQATLQLADLAMVVRRDVRDDRAELDVTHNCHGATGGLKLRRRGRWGRYRVE